MSRSEERITGRAASESPLEVILDLTDGPSAPSGGPRTVTASHIGRNGLHRRGRPVQARTAIVGTDAESVRIGNRLLGSSDGGLHPIGYVRLSGDAQPSAQPLPVLGELDDLEALIADRSIECVYIASGSIGDAEIGHILGATRSQNVEVLVSPSPMSSRRRTEGARDLGEADPKERSVVDRYRRIAVGLAVADVLSLAVALIAAHLLRFDFLPGRQYLLGIAVAGVLWLGVFHALGLYSPQHLSGFEEMRRTISAVAIGIVTVILVTFWLDVYLSRSWMVLTFAFVMALELIARRVVRIHVSRLQARRSLVLRTLVVGGGEHASELTEALNIPGSGFRPIGFVDADELFRVPGRLGSAERLERLRLRLRRDRPDCLFVASPAIGTREMLSLTQAARLEGVVVRVYTPLSGILTSRVSVQAVGRHGVALTLRPVTLSSAQRLVKRAFDFGVAAVSLLLAAPFLAAVALAIKMTSKGPVMFRQERVTEGGRIFSVFKFRTMFIEREAQAASIDASVPYFKMREDPRVTPLGRFLRSLSIDELPQLLNVIRGDMSVVGPRPLAADQVAAGIEVLAPRHEVRAGLTGWWQINGRSDRTPEEAVQMDLFYIENWSLGLDLYILLRTVGAVLRRKGAY